jgi:hypothetical protein
MATTGPGDRHRRPGGAGGTQGASQFWGTASEAHAFPQPWLARGSPLPSPARDSDFHIPESEMRPPRGKAGAAGSGVRDHGVTWPASLLLTPLCTHPGLGRAPHSAPSPSALRGLWLFPGNAIKGWGGAEVKAKGQVQARRVGEGRRLSSPPPPEPSAPIAAGEERAAPAGEVSREGLPQKGGGSDEEIRQRPHRRGTLHRLRWGPAWESQGAWRGKRRGDPFPQGAWLVGEGHP